MRIGVPKEIKANENRIALVPAGVEAFVSAGHTVMVEAGAGLGSGFDDQAFRDAGAELIGPAEAVWEQADLIMKVKEPIASEWPRMRQGQVVYTYFHFAASEELTRAGIDAGAFAVEDDGRKLPAGLRDAGLDAVARQFPRRLPRGSRSASSWEKDPGLYRKNGMTSERHPIGSPQRRRWSDRVPWMQ